MVFCLPLAHILSCFTICGLHSRQAEAFEKNMQVVHIVGVPPNHGRKCLPRRSYTEKSRNALSKMLI